MNQDNKFQSQSQGASPVGNNNNSNQPVGPRLGESLSSAGMGDEVFPFPEANLQANSNQMKKNFIDQDLNPSNSSQTGQTASAPIGTPSLSESSQVESNLKGTSFDSGASSKKSVKKIPFRLIFILLLILGIVAGLIFVVGKFLGKKTVEVKTLTWWNLWEDESVVKSLIQQYEAKNPNVKINYIKQSPQDYRERLTSALVKGDGPDIFVFHNTWTPLLVRELDSAPASVISSADLAQNYYYVISADLASQGKILGTPLGYDALTLFINEDLFREASLEPPTTWVELRDYAKVLTKVDNGKIVQSGVALGRIENVDHWQEILALMMLQNGVNFSNPDPSLVENALLFFTIFSRSDGVWDQTLPLSTEAFASGKLAMYFGPSWRAFNIKDANPSLNFRTVPLPQVPKEDPNEPDISYATYWVQGVWAKGKNKDLAWDFLKFISSENSLSEMFKQASLLRGFGEIYPRIDIANSLIEHPVLGSVVKLAPNAKSWYLASRTFDGPTGINSQLSKYFEDAVNLVNEKQDLKNATETLIQGIKQVLNQYGLSR